MKIVFAYLVALPLSLLACNHEPTTNVKMSPSQPAAEPTAMAAPGAMADAGAMAAPGMMAEHGAMAVQGMKMAAPVMAAPGTMATHPPKKATPGAGRM
jgi:hypothetical protein